MSSSSLRSLVLVTPPEETLDEIHHLCTCLDDGLTLVYLKKPQATTGELTSYLRQIPSEHHQKILIAAPHQSLCQSFKLAGFHLPESIRLSNNAPQGALSTSLHQEEILKNWDDTSLRYLFFGAVFDSISKPNYAPQYSPETLTQALKHFQNKRGKVAVPEVIGIGGITPDRVQQGLAMGFDRLAILGAFWQSNDKNATWAQFKQAYELS